MSRSKREPYTNIKSKGEKRRASKKARSSDMPQCSGFKKVYESYNIDDYKVLCPKDSKLKRKWGKMIKKLCKEIMNKDNERENVVIDLRRRHNKLKNEHKLLKKENEELKELRRWKQVQKDKQIY